MRLVNLRETKTKPPLTHCDTNLTKNDIKLPKIYFSILSLFAIAQFSRREPLYISAGSVGITNQTLYIRELFLFFLFLIHMHRKCPNLTEVRGQKKRITPNTRGCTILHTEL